MKNVNGDAAFSARIRATEKKIEELKEELETAQARITVLTQENRLLCGCVLELSEAVFGNRKEKTDGGTMLPMLYARAVMTGERRAQCVPPELERRVRALLCESGTSDDR